MKIVPSNVRYQANNLIQGVKEQITPKKELVPALVMGPQTTKTNKPFAEEAQKWLTNGLNKAKTFFAVSHEDAAQRVAKLNKEADEVIAESQELVKESKQSMESGQR